MGTAMNDDCCENMVQAIVFQAIWDLQNSTKKLKKNPNNYQAQKQKKDCERFFNSAWFETMTGCDGSSILHRLETEEIKQKKQKPARNKPLKSDNV